MRKQFFFLFYNYFLSIYLIAQEFGSSSSSSAHEIATPSSSYTTTISSTSLTSSSSLSTSSLDSLFEEESSNTINANQRYLQIRGVNCVLIERGTVPPYYDCVGCVIDRAMNCLDDLRLNKSGKYHFIDFL
jgi:hypothetical protein